MLKCNKKTNRQGFTLAELLVVVAIIAILVAVSIPIFSGKLEDARLNTDKANIRAAKAVAIGAFLQDESWQEEYENKGKVIRFYDAENGTLVDKETALTLEPYNKVQWHGTNPAGTSIIGISINEDKQGSDKKDASIVVAYRWLDKRDIEEFK